MILFGLPFQGIRDRLYQDPMEVQTPGQAFTAFLGALGLHQTGGAAGAPLCATAQLIILASQAERYQLGRSHHARWGGGVDISLPVDGYSSVRRDAVQGQMPSCGGWPGVHAALPATGTVQRSLHESWCVA